MDMSVQVVLELKVKPESVDTVTAMFKEILPDTRAYAGCEGITLHSNVDDPSNMILLERWQTREHHEKYMAWRTETGVLGKLIPLLTGAPSARYFNDIDA
jgi:quinol monooxygenase YgiN